MNLRKAEEMAQEQIKKWCPEYRFRFDKATRRFGCCWGNLKLITLSKTLTEMNDESEVLNTILHEIAHAIAGNNHGHDWYWKQACIKVGARPERCYSRERVNAPKHKRLQAKYMAVCSHCGHKSYRCRKPKPGTYSCGVCDKYKYNPLYVLEYNEIK